MGMSLDSRIYGNKASLAFLSDPKYSHIYSADELALINRYIPTTRLLSSESINFSQEQKDRLIVKPVDGQGGVGLIFGQDYLPDAWTEKMQEIVESKVPHVLQERLYPDPVDAVGWSVKNGICDDRFNLIFGVFAINSRYAGIGARGVSAAQKIVKYGNVGYMAPAFLKRGRSAIA